MTLSSVKQYVAYELSSLRAEERRIERDLATHSARPATLARAVADLERRAVTLDRMLDYIDSSFASQSVAA
jgi:hypothetical protein